MSKKKNTGKDLEEQILFHIKKREIENQALKKILNAFEKKKIKMEKTQK